MRVIGGKLRGRELGSVPDGVRPTSDRVRESLFTMLGQLDGARVLDLYAGTGALGFEAYSRGASRVVFVEQSRRISRALRKRATGLGLELVSGGELSLLAMEAKKALRVLASTQGDDPSPAFDLVFIDPPYADGDRVGILEALLSTPLVGKESVVVVEGPKRHPLPPVTGGRVSQQRIYGDTMLTWLAPDGSREG